MLRGRRAFEGAVGIGALLVASTAYAGNGAKPRVLVDWTDTPCMTIVDRSTNPVLHFTYSVAQDDTQLTEDEVDDSRTHQFFAFCRPHDLQTFLPRWITQDDIDRAIAKASAPDTIVPEDVLETSTAWTDCWLRVNADDARRPITMTAAAEGVDWDTTGVPAGIYKLEGYTFEPPFNVWSTSPGVVKVVDDPDPATSAPALAIENTEELLYQNDSVAVSGCVSAMDGATLTAYWATVEPAPEPNWTPFIEDDPVSGTSFAVEFTPPEALAGKSAMIRVDVVDPMGRSYTGFMQEFVIVLPGDNPNTCEEGGFTGGGGCPEPTDDTTGEVTTTGVGGSDAQATTAAESTDDSVGQNGDGGGEGCGCRSGSGRLPAAAGLLLLGVLGIGKRHRRR